MEMEQVQHCEVDVAISLTEREGCTQFRCQSRGLTRNRPVAPASFSLALLIATTLAKSAGSTAACSTTAPV